MFFAIKTIARSYLAESFIGPLYRKNPNQILMEIYNEIIRPKTFNEENYIKKEFFIELDSNTANKEEHVVVLNNWQGDYKKMLIQITYFKPKRENSIIKLAKKTKRITCFLRGGEINIAECDYTEKEMVHLLSKILDGIRSKKKLLQLIKD